MLLGLAVGVSTNLIFSVTSARANFEGYKSSCITGDGDSDSDSDSVSGGTAGDWTKKGSKAYNNAKIIFDTLTKKVGFGGAGAAGAVAVAIRESGLRPDAKNPSGGVAGLFQWSGWNGNHTNGHRITAGGFIDGHSDSDLTVSNEMKLMRYELDHGWKKVKESAGRATDPEAGAMAWSQDYEGVSLSDGQTKINPTKADARKIYVMFGGDKISPSSALAGASGTALSGDDGATSSKCGQADDSGSANGNIVKVAKALLGYFTYQQLHGTQYIGSVEHPDKNGVTDCSGFVWLVLAKAGYKVPANMAWNTSTMAADARGDHKYLKQVSAENAKAGDIVIVNTGGGTGSSGHTAILLENWKSGPDVTNKTKIINEGGESMGGVNEDTFTRAFLSLVNGDNGPHTTTFARAIKK